MDKKFESDMRIALLAALSTSAKGMLEPSYFEDFWEELVSDRVLSTAIESDIIFHTILEIYIYGMFADQVRQGIDYIRTLEK